MSEYLKHIADSLILNYKTWVTLFISCYFLFRNRSLHLAWIEYILCILYSYIAHRISHEPIGFLLNRAHIYHHEHTDWTSHLIQVCLEIAAVFFPIVFVYYVLNRPEIVFPINPYIFMLFSIFYTSTHNINYGMLKVNGVHYMHHKNYAVNYGPDICDIIFGTKHPPRGIENTDHYIPNIIVATAITFVFRHFYEKSSLQSQVYVKQFLVYCYAAVCGVVAIFTTKQLFIDIDKIKRKNVKSFSDQVDELLMKLNPPS